MHRHHVGAQYFAMMPHQPFRNHCQFQCPSIHPQQHGLRLPCHLYTGRRSHSQFTWWCDHTCCNTIRCCTELSSRRVTNSWLVISKYSRGGVMYHTSSPCAPNPTELYPYCIPHMGHVDLNTRTSTAGSTGIHLNAIHRVGSADISHGTPTQGVSYPHSELRAAEPAIGGGHI